MVDVKPIIVKALQNTGLKIYDDNFVNSSTPIPCITYTEYDNNTLTDGDTLGYSNIVFHITIWGKGAKVIAEYQAKIDNIMRVLGFERTGTNNLTLDDITQSKMKYKAKALEYFDIV